MLDSSKLEPENSWQSIGEGGYSHVYTSTYCGSLVAIKKYLDDITAESPEFRKEIRALKFS